MFSKMSKSLKFYAFCRQSFICQRNFCISSRCSSKQTIERTQDRRAERYMKRTVDLLSDSKRSKQKRWNFPQAFESEQCSSQIKPRSYNPRRAQQLSVVFHNYISSLISSGEVCPELLDLAFEIESVKVQPDLSTVNVYWATSASENESVIESILQKCSAELRRVLTGLRIMGHVPPIQFCKDVTSLNSQKVEELLKIADMGPDAAAEEEDEDSVQEDSIEIKSMNQKTLNEQFQQLSKSFQSNSLYRSPGDGSEIILKECQNIAENESQDQDLVNENETECSGGQMNSTALKCRKSECMSDEHSQLNMRSDLYGVPHKALVQQVLNAKRKLHERASKRKTDEDN